MEAGIKMTNEEKEAKWTEYKDQLAFTIQINDDKKDASCKLIYYLFNLKYRNIPFHTTTCALTYTIERQL